MNRFVAIGCAALFAFACGRAAEHEEEDEETSGNAGSCGTERWNVKTGIDPQIAQVNRTPQLITIAALRDPVAYPAPASMDLTRTSPRFTYAGSPELQTWLLKNVTLTQYKAEDDLDYHVVVADAAGNTMIVELADPTCITGTWKSLATAARASFNAVHTAGSSFKTANDTVSITGVGFFDPLHGQTGVAPNGIELHSVLSICFGVDCATPDFGVSANPTSFAGDGASTIAVPATLGFGGTVALTVTGLPAGASASFSAPSLTAGGTSELTLVNGSAAAGIYPLTITATSGSYVHTTTLNWTVLAGGTGVGNGNFESGLASWTTSGTTSTSSSIFHGGAQSAMVGSTSPTTDSTLAQTIALPPDATQLEVWYRVTCPDSVSYDWATITLRDNTAGTTTTVLPKTCTRDGQWKLATASVTGGHNVTLTVTNHDDNYVGDATYTNIDDVTLATGAADTAAPTVAVTSPADGSTVAGTVTVTAAATDNVGVSSIELYVDGALLASSATSAWNTATVNDGAHTLTAKAYDAAGNVALSVPITVTVANVTTVANPILNAGFEDGSLTGWTGSGSASVRNVARTGSFAASLGAATPTTDSTLAQTFVVPENATTLGFWVRVVCPDTVAYDWVTASLRDNDTGLSALVLAKTCTNDGAFHQVTAGVNGMRGHSVTLTFVNHDDNYAGDATWSLWDDVTLQ